MAQDLTKTAVNSTEADLTFKTLAGTTEGDLFNEGQTFIFNKKSNLDIYNIYSLESKNLLVKLSSFVLRNL